MIPALAFSVLTSALLVATGDPCAQTFDRTDDDTDGAGAAQCASPASLDSTIVTDAKPAPEAPARDPLIVPQQIGLAAFGAAAIGVGALAWTEVRGGNAPLSSDERQMLRIGGVSFLAASGAMVAASAALVVFDPSTGKMRLSFEDGD